jgi:hypothetical protein
VVAKVAAWYPENAEGLTEYNNLKWFAQANQRPDIDCPRPLAFLPAENVLLTEWVSGIPLKQIIVDSLLITRSRPDDRITRAVERCGGWLRQYHALHSSHAEISLNSTDPERGWGESLIERCRRKDTQRLLSLADVAHIATSLHSLQAPKRLTAEQSIEHRDFAYGNILVRPSSITVFDLGSQTIGPVLRDVAYFYTMLSLFLRLRLARPLLAAHYTSAFLRTYFGRESITPSEQVLLAVFGIEALLRQAHRHGTLIAKIPPGARELARAFTRWRYRGLLADLRCGLDAAIFPSPAAGSDEPSIRTSLWPPNSIAVPLNGSDFSPQ